MTDNERKAREGDWRHLMDLVHRDRVFDGRNFRVAILAADAELTRLREAVEWAGRIRDGVAFSTMKELYTKEEVCGYLDELRLRAKEG